MIYDGIAVEISPLEDFTIEEIISAFSDTFTCFEIEGDEVCALFSKKETSNHTVVNLLFFEPSKKCNLVSKGVPDGMIIEESNSTSTFENFEFSKDIADTLPGGDRIVFVTSRFHIYRASRYAAGAGFEAHHIGARVPFYELPSNYLREMLAVVKFFNWEKIFPINEAGV